MTPLRPGRLVAGWFVSLWAAGLMVCSWLPWLTTGEHGGGRASAIGGTLGSIVLPPHFGSGQLIVLLSSVLIVLGAMSARNVYPRLAAAAAVVVSLLVAVLTWSFFHSHVHPPVAAGYGLYLGAACALGALACSLWALLAARR